MKSRYIFSNLLRNTVKSCIACTTCIAVWSCSDDTSAFVPDGYVEAGLPASVTLRWDIPDMGVQSRSLTDAEASKVNDLWIGIYDADTRQLKDRFYFTAEHDDIHSAHPLKDLPTTSGRVYIVGVANTGNRGLSSDPSLNAAGSQLTGIRTMLENADNLDKYLSIAAAISSPTQIEYTSANLIMSGTYLENLGASGTDHPEGHDWTKLPVVTIPAGNVDLNTGKLHLRRVISQVSFHIKSGTGITIRPTQWRVINNPRMSYLQEQPANAGDKFTNLLTDTDPNANYGESHPITEILQTTVNKENVYVFDFYTFENRRTGLETCREYKDREQEFKTSTGTGVDGKEHFSNTGIYRSLCASDDKPDLRTKVNINNFATMVEIKCDISYPVEINGSSVQRSGTAVYSIHLGYMNNDARDFNVYRNHKYNYTLTILGLNQIILEADGDEVYTGLEGNVVDATSESIVLDAHYGMYNIQLSNFERARLRYSIEAPYANEVKTVEGWGIRNNGLTPPSNPPSEDNEYYNWIRIKPTPSQNIFAEYKSSADDEPWYLHDLIVQDNGQLRHRHTNDSQGNTDDHTQRWYTVFVNENVYEGDGHPLSDWVNYVNKDMRSVLFLVQDVKVSNDNESRYTQGKYRLRQRSIQTYYTPDPAAYGSKPPTALGVEHVNESYGKKIAWDWVVGSTDASTNDKALSLNNGRWNQWKFLMSATNGSTDPAGQQEATRPWRCQYTSLNMTFRRNAAYGLLQYVTATGSATTESSGYIRADENGYPVPALISYPSATDTRNQDPDGKGGYYEAMALCMSRNRDLDGDGRISPDEVRWYLPAEGKYERIMLGRNALETPLFSVAAGSYYCNSNDPVALDNGNFGYNGSMDYNGSGNQLHFASSNHMKFFADEGGSYNRDLGAHWSGAAGNRYPWNIRCVRNLGVDLSTVTTDMNEDPIDKAYTTEKSADGNHTVFVQRYYYGRSVRPSLINDFMPPHTVADMEKNRIAKKFMVANELVSVVIGPKNGTADDPEYSSFEEALIDNAPCKNLKDSSGAIWRTPNQREIMMILNEGITSGHETYSCTQDAYPANGRFAAAGVNPPQIQMMPRTNTDGSKPNTIYVRCVRDIE